MKLLSRLIVVLCVLGGLGYGSYAFGRYVLSRHLFGALHKQGASTSVASASVGKTDLRGGKPRVEVEVLPADSAGPGPALPPSDALERHAAEFKSDNPTSLSQEDRRNRQSAGPKAGAGAHLGQREFDNADGMDVNDGSGGFGDGSSRRRARERLSSDRWGSGDRPRRRRRTHSFSTSSNPSQSSPAHDESSPRELPSRVESGGSSSSSGSSGFERPSRSASEEPRAHRRSNDAGERSHRARSESPDSHGSSGSGESPIPHAESSGGESPIPKPE